MTLEGRTAGDELPVEPPPERKRKRITLFRVALLLAAIVLSTTIWWTWRESRLESAERTLAAAEKKGYEALRQADFVTAELEFDKAVQALNVLGHEDDHARAIRQMHRETTAANELIGKPLFEIVEDVHKVPAGDGGRRQEYFRAHYAGDWIIVDAPVQRLVDADGTAKLTSDYPLAIGGHRVVLQTDAGAFEPLAFGEKPKRLIFAAQLQTCRLDGTDKKRWVISLRPETAFLWADADNYRALGFADADEAGRRSTRELLERQARLQGGAG